ncbi:hypothetical protein CDL12_06372 [Handroanthus impetiginosus]|uniref:Stomagen C-terminal domain-containing protein n=1 Tax=Handroanthus impetiginosus TaxID=429701 RepID=A0A2G9HTV2_9LAMI|nr:hypothetical protein CDL12_06372 [Handroanthus impetiginosus]
MVNFDFKLLFIALFCAAVLVQGATGSRVLLEKQPTDYRISSAEREVNLKNNAKRIGCRYKCRAEQVPVEGNDPINSPYHYKCVCHR